VHRGRLFFGENNVSWGFLFWKGRIPSKGNFIQTLSCPFIEAPAIDEIGTRSVGLDGNPRQDGANSTGDSIKMFNDEQGTKKPDKQE
jgi:hypothetical protein